MFITKHAAELCALLVNDLYGELPSRILVVLFSKGRSNVAQLLQYTELTPRHVRHGLGVLVQQNLLYHHTDPDTKRTTYEVNAYACYNLVRSGKILEMIDNQYGKAERDLVQTLLLLGYARIAELTHAYESRVPKTNGHMNGANGHSSGLIRSESELHDVLNRLIRAEIVETVRPASFRNPNDVYQEIEHEITKTAPGEKATKTKMEQQRQIIEQYRTFRDQGTALKRQLDQFGAPMPKRRKLQNGHSHSLDYGSTPLNPNVVVRINYEKCLVELRNHRLADFAADTLGDITGEVYRLLLEILTSDTSRCRVDPLLGDEPQEQIFVTTNEIYEHLDDNINVGSGIGKAPKDKIDFQSAEKVHNAPVGQDIDSDDSDLEPSGGNSRSFGLDSDDDSDDVGASSKKARSNSKTNGSRPTKVKFEDSATTAESRIDQLRAHLLLLAESKHRFLRHCGTMGRGQWTVDFGPLMGRLQETELDSYLEQSFGRYGLRLTRILREKGKLDEKMLPSAALMKKADVQGKMLEMQMAGVVDVQEVPKDNTRLAARTLFLWYFDTNRAQSRILDDLYKAMVRCLQTLQVERHKERNILSFVDRKDVRGKEEEVMTAEHYNKYNRHLEEQNKLLGQVMRLDDIVSVFRDY